MIFRADFDLPASRMLTGSERTAFREFFVEDGTWHACAPLLRVNRGNFFHWVYQIEVDLGRELVRRGVFPLNEYFNAAGRVGEPRNRWGGIAL
jgi:hypothetical protein